MYPYRLNKINGRYILSDFETGKYIFSDDNKTEVMNEYYVRLAINTHGSSVRDNTRDQLISIGLDIDKEGE